MAMTPKAVRDYIAGTSEDFRTRLCHEPSCKTGINVQTITPLDDDSDSEDEEDEEEDFSHHEDNNSLLVKAWETKVFPIIRRRFRNETERKDGFCLLYTSDAADE